MSGPAKREGEKVLAKLREICLAFPETSERLSHGAPTFFVREKRSFLMVLTNHHGDGRFAIWCAAPDGMQKTLVEAEPDRFFVPPYVGHRGRLGLRLDRSLDWQELAGVVEDAYAEVAPAKLVEEARCRGVEVRARKRRTAERGRSGATRPRPSVRGGAPRAHSTRAPSGRHRRRAL